MLHNSVKKRLRERNWLEFERTESNPSQSWRRIRDASVNAINDLALIAQKIPEDKQNEIFGYENIRKLLTSLFEIRSLGQDNENISLRHLELASLLVDVGTSICRWQIRNLNRDTPSLAEATIQHLDKSVEISKDLVYRIELNKLEEVGREQDLVYLFKWSKLSSRDGKRLLRFLEAETNKEIFYNLVSKGITADNRIKTYEIRNVEDVPIGNLSIELNSLENKARLSLRCRNDSEEFVKDLIVKSDYRDFYLYAKKPRKRS